MAMGGLDETAVNMTYSTAPGRAYLTVAEFCERFNIGKTLYYTMRAAGDGPVELRIGRRKVVISLDAVQAWEKEHMTGSR
jgi:hypothetical protein